MSTTAFPTGGREIVERMTRKYPELFVNDDEEQRKLTRKINEQFAFVYGPKWGGKKRAGVSDALQSKDSQAVQEDDGTTTVWDMFSSGLAILVHDGDIPPATHANLPASEATFMPVTPTNWLGDDVEPEPEPEPEPDSELAQVVEAHSHVILKHEDRIDVLEAAVVALADRLEKVEAELAQPLKVVGKTEAMWGHQHIVNLNVGRRESKRKKPEPPPNSRSKKGMA